MSRVPRLPAVTPGPLDLTPPEAFLLSRVDALLDEHDLALVSGMTPAQVSAALDRLAALGAVEIVEVDPRAGASDGARPARAPTPAPAPAARAPGDGDEDVELEPARRRRVLELYGRLDELTYYALLGVGPDADKKQVKSAYYALAPDYHPDKYFRKKLGSYKPKIEAIFARITLAHDVLTARERRAEYDAYLEQTRKNEAMAAVFDDSPPDVSSVLAAVEQAASRALAESPLAPAVSPAPVPEPPRAGGNPPAQPAPPGDRRPSTPSMSAVSAPPPPGLSQEEVLRLRREALARKLGGGARRPTPPPTPTARPSSPAVSLAHIERAAEALRQRREAAVAEAKRAQVQRLLDSGRAAMEKEDYAGAANAYRLVASFAPEDAAVQATCSDALRRAAAALADGYWRQALYEEQQERWNDAALSFSRVCTGRPDSAIAHERVAFATLKAGGNARRSVEFARRAVELDPKKPDFRVTLARAYAAAGLEKSAVGELDRALTLAPDDPRVKAVVAAARSALSPKGEKVS